MTCRFLGGFNDSGTRDPVITYSGSGSVTTGSARTGFSGFNFGGTTGTVATILPTGLSSSTVYFGAAFRFNAFSVGSVIQFAEGATVHCRVGTDASGHVTIYGPAATVVATSTATLPPAAWAYLEAKAVIADVGGSVEVRLDETVIVSFSGDTRNGGTGVVNSIILRGNGDTVAMDDLYILDSAGASLNGYQGDIAIRSIVPNGNGASSQWTGSDGDSVNNYQLVDETPTSFTDYVGAASAGLTDFYAMEDIPTTDLPLAIQFTMRAQKSDAGTPPVLKPALRGDGTTVVEDTAVTLSSTAGTFMGAIRTTDPDGDALTATNVNGMQAGLKTS